MTPWLRRTLTAATLAVSASGVAYLWMKDVLTTDDPFSLVNHPLEPWMLTIHVLASPILIAVFGMAVGVHVLPKLHRPGPARRSGVASLSSFAAAGLSGYLLQVATAPGWTTVLVVTHVTGGTVFAASYLLHIVTGLRARLPGRVEPARRWWRAA